MKAFLSILAAVLCGGACLAAEAPAQKDVGEKPHPRDADPAVRQFFQTLGPYVYDVACLGREDLRQTFRGWRGQPPDGQDKDRPSAPPLGPGIHSFLWRWQRCLSMQPGDGSLEVRVRSVDAKGLLCLHSVDRAAAVFTVKRIVPPDKQAPLLDLLAKDTGKVEALAGQGSDFWKKFREDLAVDAQAPEYAGALEAARQAYDARRPELIRKFSGSWLYYPPAAEARWTLHKKLEGLLVAVARCFDRMYVAEFHIEMKKDENGRWTPSRTSGFEILKGE